MRYRRRRLGPGGGRPVPTLSWRPSRLGRLRPAGLARRRTWHWLATQSHVRRRFATRPIFASLSARRNVHPQCSQEGGDMGLRRRAAMLAAVAAAVVLLVAGPAGAVLRGTTDTANRFANVGVLQLNVDGDWSDFCSGTLVRADIVLTAAHCTDFLIA